MENLDFWEKEVVQFLNQLDFNDVSRLLVSPSVLGQIHYTYFYFYTSKGKVVELYYMKNQKTMDIVLWEDRTVIGRISLEENEKNESKEKWMNAVWEQFVDHFQLRIRLMFINEHTAWKWNNEFFVQKMIPRV